MFVLFRTLLLGTCLSGFFACLPLFADRPEDLPFFVEHAGGETIAVTPRTARTLLVTYDRDGDRILNRLELSSITELTVYDCQNLDWLPAFNNLVVLEIDGPHPGTLVPDLDELTQLQVLNIRLSRRDPQDLPRLPESLLSLTMTAVTGNSLDLSYLPWLRHVTLTYISEQPIAPPRFPRLLESLTIENYDGFSLEPLRETPLLHTLDLSGKAETNLIELPLPPLEGLRVLRLAGLGLVGYPDLPPHLHTLAMPENQLSALPPASSPLTYLDLSRNPLTSAAALPQFTRLEHLNLEFGVLTELPTALPPHLEYLNLAHNELTELNGLDQLPLLIELNASYNPIRQIPTLANLHHLRRLELERTQLDALPSLRDLGRLQVLNLAYNTALSHLVDFDHLVSLRKGSLLSTAFPIIPDLGMAANLEQFCVSTRVWADSCKEALHQAPLLPDFTCITRQSRSGEFYTICTLERLGWRVNYLPCEGLSARQNRLPIRAATLVRQGGDLLLSMQGAAVFGDGPTTLRWENTDGSVWVHGRPGLASQRVPGDWSEGRRLHHRDPLKDDWTDVGYPLVPPPTEAPRWRRVLAHVPSGSDWIQHVQLANANPAGGLTITATAFSSQGDPGGEVSVQLPAGANSTINVHDLFGQNTKPGWVLLSAPGPFEAIQSLKRRDAAVAYRAPLQPARAREGFFEIPYEGGRAWSGLILTNVDRTRATSVLLDAHDRDGILVHRRHVSLEPGHKWVALAREALALPEDAAVIRWRAEGLVAAAVLHGYRDNHHALWGSEQTFSAGTSASFPTMRPADEPWIFNPNPEWSQVDIVLTPITEGSVAPHRRRVWVPPFGSRRMRLDLLEPELVGPTHLAAQADLPVRFTFTRYTEAQDGLPRLPQKISAQGESGDRFWIAPAASEQTRQLHLENVRHDRAVTGESHTHAEDGTVIDIKTFTLAPGETLTLAAQGRGTAVVCDQNIGGLMVHQWVQPAESAHQTYLPVLPLGWTPGNRIASDPEPARDFVAVLDPVSAVPYGDPRWTDLETDTAFTEELLTTHERFFDRNRDGRLSQGELLDITTLDLAAAELLGPTLAALDNLEILVAAEDTAEDTAEDASFSVLLDLPFPRLRIADFGKTNLAPESLPAGLQALHLGSAALPNDGDLSALTDLQSLSFDGTNGLPITAKPLTQITVQGTGWRGLPPLDYSLCQRLTLDTDLEGDLSLKDAALLRRLTLRTPNAARLTGVPDRLQGLHLDGVAIAFPANHPVLTEMREISLAPRATTDQSLNLALFPALERLHAAKAGLTELRGAFATSMRELVISENGLEAVPSLAGLTQLRLLLAENNRLQELLGLDEASALETLRLQNNRLGELPSFANLVNLRWLNVSENEDLAELPAISSCRNLQFLNIEDCGFHRLPDVRDLNQVERFLIYGNPFDNMCADLAQLMLASPYWREGTITYSHEFRSTFRFSPITPCYSLLPVIR